MNKNNSYILHLKNIKARDEELTGHKALEKSLLIREGFSTTPGFVLTSLAFDDFLRSTNLVEPISLLLSEVKPFIKETAESVSEEIRNLILKAEIPKIIELPFVEAYKNLSPVLEDSFVSVTVSNIIDEKFIPKDFSFKIENIKGMVQIADAIKEGWLTLFTPEALEYRVNEYYHGPLSTALIISRMGAGDVSGEFLFTGESTAEIRAIYGIGNISENSKESDIYFTNPLTKVITDKISNPQKTMKIRKGSFKKGQDILMDIEISDDWQEKQKVPDNLLNLILENVSRLYSILKQPFKFKWCIEAGTVLIEEYEILTKYAEPTILGDIMAKPVVQAKEKVKETKEASGLNTEIMISENSDEMPIIEIEKDNQLNPIKLLDVKEEELGDYVLDSDANYQGRIQTILDISKMSSSKIHSVKYFDKCYFDGTESILDSGVLKNLQNPDKAIETIYVELLAAARAAASKDFIYSFSNFNYLNKEDEDGFTGDERFIDRPEEMLVEYVALRKVAELFKMDSLNLVLPSLRSFSNLKDLLRILRTFPQYYTINNKIFAEISVPSFLFELTKLTDEVSGIILNYHKLLRLMVYRKSIRTVDNQIMFDVMSELKKVADHKNLAFYVKLDSYKDPIIDQILELENVGIIFKSVPSKEILSKLQKGGNAKLNLKL